MLLLSTLNKSQGQSLQKVLMHAAQRAGPPQTPPQTPSDVLIICMIFNAAYIYISYCNFVIFNKKPGQLDAEFFQKFSRTFILFVFVIFFAFCD